jgi:ubiquinone/menaquinone biosynthesis C-methylase UbiE
MTDTAAVAQRVEREQAFHDHESRAFALGRKLVVRTGRALNRERAMTEWVDPNGKVVLDYGCGKGRQAMRLLERGARQVTGFDISAHRIEEAEELARTRAVEDRTHFVVADAHDTGLPGGTFDLVAGAHILHHLDFEVALREIDRLLAPGGRAVFVEPLAHNPILRLGRLLTLFARTADEAPLTDDHWRLCREIFPGFVHHEVELTTILVMPVNALLPRRASERLAHRLWQLDDRLLERRPSLGRWARKTILVLERGDAGSS